MRSHCRATSAVTHLRNFLIFPNWDSVSIKRQLPAPPRSWQSLRYVPHGERDGVPHLSGIILRFPFVCLFMFYFLAVIRSMWGLRPLTRSGIRAPTVEAQTLNRWTPGKSLVYVLLWLAFSFSVVSSKFMLYHASEFPSFQKLNNIPMCVCVCTCVCTCLYTL